MTATADKPTKIKMGKVKDAFGKPLERDEKYMVRLFERALSEEVKKDVVVEFGRYDDLSRKYDVASWKRNATTTGQVPVPSNTRKVKAYCRDVNAFLQFPSKLRREGSFCICDISSTTSDKSKGTFWRYVKGTVRKSGSDIVVA